MDFTEAVISFLPPIERAIIQKLDKDLKLLQIYKTVDDPLLEKEWIQECIEKTKEKADKLVRETLSQYRLAKQANTYNTQVVFYCELENRNIVYPICYN